MPYPYEYLKILLGSYKSVNQIRYTLKNRFLFLFPNLYAPKKFCFTLKTREDFDQCYSQAIILIAHAERCKLLNYLYSEYLKVILLFRVRVLARVMLIFQCSRFYSLVSFWNNCEKTLESNTWTFWQMFNLKHFFLTWLFESYSELKNLSLTAIVQQVQLTTMSLY